jgi:hypothetical protein
MLIFGHAIAELVCTPSLWLIPPERIFFSLGYKTMTMSQEVPKSSIYCGFRH